MAKTRPKKVGNAQIKTPHRWRKRAYYCENASINYSKPSRSPRIIEMPNRLIAKPSKPRKIALTSLDSDNDNNSDNRCRGASIIRMGWAFPECFAHNVLKKAACVCMQLNGLPLIVIRRGFCQWPTTDVSFILSIVLKSIRGSLRCPCMCGN